MDNSTNGVTVLGVFFNDIINMYKDKPDIHSSLIEIVKDLDLSDPMKMQPMSSYNELCDWIDHNLGKVNSKIAGKQIGETVFSTLVNQKTVQDNATPLQIMKALSVLAKQVIIDPKKRGWEIMENSPNRILIRRTQTFNSNLQFGVLEGLLYKCKDIKAPRVHLIKEVARGQEFDDYELTWS